MQKLFKIVHQNLSSLETADLACIHVIQNLLEIQFPDGNFFATLMSPPIGGILKEMCEVVGVSISEEDARQVMVSTLITTFLTGHGLRLDLAKATNISLEPKMQKPKTFENGN